MNADEMKAGLTALLNELEESRKEVAALKSASKMTTSVDDAHDHAKALDLLLASEEVVAALVGRVAEMEEALDDANGRLSDAESAFDEIRNAVDGDCSEAEAGDIYESATDDGTKFLSSLKGLFDSTASAR